MLNEVVVAVVETATGARVLTALAVVVVAATAAAAPVVAVVVSRRIQAVLVEPVEIQISRPVVVVAQETMLPAVMAAMEEPLVRQAVRLGARLAPGISQEKEEVVAQIL
jgi:hypothetical protein